MILNTRKLTAALLTASVAATLTLVAPARADLKIDFINSANFAEKNELVFFADLINDDTGLVYKDQDPAGEGIQVFIDDQPIEGAISVSTFKEANELMAVSVLMAAHYNYADNLSDDPPKSVLTEVKDGFKRFFGALSDQDRVSAWFYTEKEALAVSSWSNSPKSVASSIETMVQGAKEMAPTLPTLYTHIKSVLESFGKDSQNPPRRKILVVVSDGQDALASDPSKKAILERKINELVELATDPSNAVKVYVIGYSNDTSQEAERALVQLQDLASRTGGVYRRVPVPSGGGGVPQLGLDQAIEDLARELLNQYVITLKPKEYGGSEKAVSIRMEVVTTKGGAKLSRKVEDVKIGQRPTDWGKILMYVGIGLGSLLGVFLIIFLIKKIASSRKNRPVQVEQQEQFVGPYKGRLMATAGAYAGQEFFITEDVTTIGSMPGNTIVLAEGGVSKRHAGIKVEDMRFELADFGSTNGTFVNGAKVTKQFLKDGDEIRLGDNKLRFTLK